MKSELGKSGDGGNAVKTWSCIMLQYGPQDMTNLAPQALHRPLFLWLLYSQFFNKNSISRRWPKPISFQSIGHRIFPSSRTVKCPRDLICVSWANWPPGLMRFHDMVELVLQWTSLLDLVVLPKMETKMTKANHIIMNQSSLPETGHW